MKRRRAVSLRGKITALTMLCSAVALITTAIALGVYEWMAYRRTLFSHLNVVSTLTARNSAAALAFDNPEDGARVLATLQAEQTVTAAALYDIGGEKVAEFSRAKPEIGTPLRAPRDGVRIEGGHAEFVVPVREEKRFGTLLVRADVRIIGQRLAMYSLLLLGTTAASGLLAFLLSGRLSRAIVAPVQALVAAATGVRTKSDYSVRVPSAGEDELGQLTGAFNEMLARVEENEKQIYRSNERLRLALASAKIGTWDWNLVRDEVVWSERNYEIFGVPRDTRITSQVFFDQIHPDDRLRVKASVEGAVRESSDFAVEFRLAQPERPVRHALARGMFLKSSAGDPLRAVGVTIDITERRGAEQRVIESEMRFRAMAERAPALIWSCDQALNRDYFNKTWLQFTGRTLEQELGAGWQSGVPTVDFLRWQETVSAAAVQLDPYSIEYRLRRHDGALRWVIESGSPRLGADGSFMGYLGSCIDITARKENEAELEAHVRLRTRELEIANQELETFSYSVSHDLRGPVRAIEGFAEIAREECRSGDPAAAVERLDRIAKAAERMNKLIDAFIGMARISRAELVLERVNVSQITEEIVGFLRSAHAGRVVAVSIASQLECYADERLLRIALENLLSNAWKFTSKKPDARIEVGETIKEGRRAIFVRDNGAGFDRALAHKLFHAFERLHHTSQFEGLGVGLSTVQRVVEKHRGRVWAEGVEGEGATFYVALPDADEAAAPLPRIEAA
jgi:PAS domain S-box-containing protein